MAKTPNLTLSEVIEISLRDNEGASSHDIAEAILRNYGEEFVMSAFESQVIRLLANAIASHRNNRNVTVEINARKALNWTPQMKGAPPVMPSLYADERYVVNEEGAMKTLGNLVREDWIFIAEMREKKAAGALRNAEWARKMAAKCTRGRTMSEVMDESKYLEMKDMFLRQS